MKNSTLGYAIAVALVVFVLDSSYYTVDQRNAALVLRFGRAEKVVMDPGFHPRIPFVDTALKFDQRLHLTESGEQNATTQDQRAVRVSAYVKWRITDLMAFYRAGPMLAGTDLISKPLSRVLDDQISAHSLRDCLGADAAMLGAMKAAMIAQTHDLGIEIADLQLKSVTLPKDADFTNAVYARMTADRQRIAAELRAQGEEEARKIRAEADGTAQTVLAEAYRRAEELRGEGDARATEIYARAYGQDPEFFAFYRSLNAYRDSFKDQHDVLVIDPKGAFFKYFHDSGSAGK